MANHLPAEWFWVDRWTGSAGHVLPLHARGLYREMLSQAWARGAKLPNDFDLIRRCCAVTAREWKNAWPLVQPFWRVDGYFLVNDTQREIYAVSERSIVARRQRAQAAAQARWKHSSSNAQAILEQCPLISNLPSLSKERTEREQATDVAALSPTNTDEQIRTKKGEHLRHAICGRICLHLTQFDQFARRIGGDDLTFAANVVREWASGVLELWNEPPRLSQPIVGNPFQWWDARYDEWQGTREESDLAIAYREWTIDVCPHDPKCGHPGNCLRRQGRTR